MARQNLVSLLHPWRKMSLAATYLRRQMGNISYRLREKTELWDKPQKSPMVRNVLPTTNLTTKVIFDNHKIAEFKNVWLRDNCLCPKCVDGLTRQKMFDTPSLDINIKPNSLKITNDGGSLIVSWQENNQEHQSIYDSSWLYQYGQSFLQQSFEGMPSDVQIARPPLVLWGKDKIWQQLPQISYHEVMETDEGLREWLEMIYKYGIAIMRQVPTEQGQIIEVVKHFAYVKETQYGLTFDVVHVPDPVAHPAYSGLHLHHHTDMNYREKSPGIQLLHCLKASTPGSGGISLFVDGFRVAKWLENNEPAAFHILTSTPVNFQLKNKGKYYSQHWPIICTSPDGDLTEIHYNNRTMGPLQAPSHIVVPFYHAYKLFSEKVREESSELRFHLAPGDLVAFNNRRILHGRTSFDPQKVNRHLEGCYVDTDEVVSILDLLISQK